MIYRLFGWWYRWQACKMAAVVIAGWTTNTNDAISPKLWSITVFFEKYMVAGADNTAEEFGPTAPVELNIVNATAK